MTNFKMYLSNLEVLTIDNRLMKVNQFKNAHKTKLTISEKRKIVY